MEYLPFVSALIVAYNEEKHIGACLKSLLEQNYPKSNYEIIIIDGGSTDKTLSIAKKLVNEYKTTAPNSNSVNELQVSFLNNPKKILASGWNLGIKESKGEYVVRIDAHAYAHNDFLLESVKTMLSINDVVCVGGAMETESTNPKGELIKKILSSPFGVGGAKFRYMKSPGYVDTVAYGLYKKSIFEEIGFFDETLVRTQDNDLHRRIRASGGKFYLNPSIKTVYYSRDSVSKMVKQAFQNGKWTMINFRRKPGKMALRHFIPFLFIGGVVGSLILGLIYRPFLLLSLLVTFIHLSVGMLFSFKLTNKPKDLLNMPLLFLLLHSSYGLGSFRGILYKIDRSS